MFCFIFFYPRFYIYGLEMFMKWYKSNIKKKSSFLAVSLGFLYSPNNL